MICGFIVLYCFCPPRLDYIYFEYQCCEIIKNLIPFVVMKRLLLQEHNVIDGCYIRFVFNGARIILLLYILELPYVNAVYLCFKEALSMFLRL